MNFTNIDILYLFLVLGASDCCNRRSIGATNEVATTVEFLLAMDWHLPRQVLLPTSTGNWDVSMR